MPNQVLNMLLAQWQCSNLGPSPYPYYPTSIPIAPQSSLTEHRVAGGGGGEGGGSYLNIHKQQQNPAVSPTTAPTAIPKPTGKVPLMNRDFPDPSIIRHTNGTYYAFATASGGRNVQAAWSPAPSGPWTYIDQEILPFSGNWTLSGSVPISTTTTRTTTTLGGGNTWAPDVRMLRPNHYVMYYSGQLPGNNSAFHCVGAATATSILGPYTPQETPLACPLSRGGAIDPSGFVDEDTGRRYVVYKVDGNSLGHGGECNNGVAPYQPTPIILQEVDRDDGVTILGPGVEILDRVAEQDGPLVEAPSLVRVLTTSSSSQSSSTGTSSNSEEEEKREKKQSKAIYVLFYSSHCWMTDLYRVNYATADNVTGPYVRAAKKDGDGDGDGGLLPLIGTGDKSFNLTSPGGATGLDGGGSMVFHANCPEGRCLFETGFEVSFDGVVSVV